MNTQFSEKQSIELINEMIERAKNNFQKGSATPTLFWGYVTASVAILNFVLFHVLSNPYQSFSVWILMFPAQIVSFFISKRIDKKAIVKTHIDKIIDTTWSAFGISVFLFLVTVFATAYRMDSSDVFFLINPVILIMLGFAEFITAKTCRFKPFLFGSLVFWIGSVCCILSSVLFSRIDIQIIIVAICMVGGFIVPGHLLNKKIKSNV